ncbi:MAG: DoxX family protein [Flavobacteriales bacterium]|jgi:hypothetical protein|nr:DoxX family protein [Flavobacteriales bacterium]MCI1752325.1 DoxX family protein [Flavobacteriales bacterium]
MNDVLWAFQIFLAVAFLYSGINKAVLSEAALVAKGQTGVEGLPLWAIRFIAWSEIFGVVGILLPQYFYGLSWLTAMMAACFAVIMVLAARIHAKRKEPKSVVLNAVIFAVCIFVVWGRFLR